MTVRDFYYANDNISCLAQITVHPENNGTYGKMIDKPLSGAEFRHYEKYVVTNFRVDENGHWHLQVARA